MSALRLCEGPTPKVGVQVFDVVKRSGRALIASVALALAASPVSAANFAPTDVPGLIAAINTANANREDDVIDLGGRTFTLTAVDNTTTDGPNGLPGILGDGGRSLTIRNGTIERDPAAPLLRFLRVSADATLSLETTALRSGSLRLSPYPHSGAAILNSGTLTVVASTLSDNDAWPKLAGAILNNGSLDVTASVFSGNFALFAGAILNNGSLSVSGCTFVQNGAEAGAAAIENDATISAIRNTTFSRNRTLSGGAISNYGSIGVISNSTFAFDEGLVGGTIDNGVFGEILELSSNIIAANLATTAPDIANEGSIVSAFDNVIGVGDGSGILNGVNGNQVGSSGAPLDPLLGPLADNGGSTFTHALLPGSPAIDRGSNPAGLAYDQRGAGFARVAGARADAGAFELQMADLSVVKTGTPDPVLAGASMTWTVTVQNAGPGAALTVAVSDLLPAGTTFVSVGAPAGWSCSAPAVGANGTVSCSTASLSVGSAAFSIVATVDAATPPGTILSNAASVTAVTPDPDSADTTATATTTVISPALLSATKTVSGAFAPGGQVTYAIVLSNAGPGAQADNPGDELVDVLPAELVLDSAIATSGTTVATVGTNTVTWNGSIPGGGTVTMTIVATVRPTTPLDGSVSNQATIAFDRDGNGTNEASGVSDDPATTAEGDPTVFVAADAVVVPVMGGFGLLAMAALVGAAGLAVRPR